MHAVKLNLRAYGGDPSPTSFVLMSLCNSSNLSGFLDFVCIHVLLFASSTIAIAFPTLLHRDVACVLRCMVHASLFVTTELTSLKGGVELARTL